MRDEGVNLLGAVVGERLRRRLDRATRVGHVVDQDGNLVPYVADEEFHLALGVGTVALGAVPVDQGKVAVEAVGEVGCPVQSESCADNSAATRRRRPGTEKARGTHRLAPPASGETMIAFFQSGMFSFTHLFAMTGHQRVCSGKVEWSPRRKEGART